ncbi:DUF6207 family protein [Streptomyces sp. NPDC006314]|uniref:DUF6207 family protein n=1 Tax=Streptomyces sp. NPDC006314 TaxID=3154475 RepID=UPI0033A5A23F
MISRWSSSGSGQASSSTLTSTLRKDRTARWPGRSTPSDPAAPDDATTFAFQKLLAERRATATGEYTTRDSGQSGVWLRCYLDLRQELTTAALAGPPMEPTRAWP